MTSSRRESHSDFETVIDQPLERGQRPNHRNPHWQAVPEACESDVAVNS